MDINQKPKVLVFAGAGASKAVSPKNYPTTIEFFDNLPESITSNKLFQQVVNFLEESSDEKTIDIELLLWRLGELQKFCNLYQDQSKLPGWILANNRLARTMTGKGMNIRSVTDLIKSTSSEINELISEINARVYDFYARLPKENEIDKTWNPLLKGLHEIGAKVEIVTTNYDMIIETALANSSIVDTGWEGQVVRTLNIPLWQKEGIENTPGLLTKLHGSINWTRNGNKIFVSDPNFTGNHDSHFIIYPGFKGRPSNRTFLSFHNHFDKVLSQSNVAIFIGFAFRDDYINDICEKSSTRKTKVIVINPAEDLELPFVYAKSHHIKSGFDRKSVDFALEMVQDEV